MSSPPAKLTPVERKKLMRFGESKDVEERYHQSSLCIKHNGIWKQAGR